MASAYAVAARNGTGGWEVLLAQKYVIDYEHTLDPLNTTLWITNNPGEFVIPGGGINPKESPADAALREFCEETQTPLPGTSTLTLFHSIGSDAFFYLIRADQNGWLDLADDKVAAKRNSTWASQYKAITVPTSGPMTSTVAADQYTELANLFWTPLASAPKLFDSKAPWVNSFQQNEYGRAQKVAPQYKEQRPPGRWSKVNGNRRIFPDWFLEALTVLAKTPPK